MLGFLLFMLLLKILKDTFFDENQIDISFFELPITVSRNKLDLDLILFLSEARFPTENPSQV